MKINDNKLVVVLGMHRSGTSAVTRGLQVMGVNLGNELLPPQEDNITGFWEDVDINALNIEMLNSLNSDWHFLTPIQQSDIDILCRNGYVQRAIEILQDKMAGVEVFGLKDPRIAKLLPFWKEAFTQCQFKVSYVLAIRHPLSVCKSLQKRHGFDVEKSSLLWLEHVIYSLVGTDNENCVLVDYDRLVQSPEVELKRIAKGLQLQIDPLELGKFKAEFLNEELRHTVYQLNDLILENSMLPLVQEVYSTLINVAADNIRIEDKTIKDKIAHWMNEFSRLTLTLIFIDKLNSRIKNIIAERDAQVAEKEQMIQSLRTQVTQKEQIVLSLNQQINEIFVSKAWKFALFLRQIRAKLLPIGSRRENLIRLIYSAFKVARDEGLGSMVHRIRDRLTCLVGVSSPFKRWVLNNEPDQKELAEQREAGRQFQYRPLVSIITPVYKTPIKILNAAIQSVIEQTYDNWELCIANGSPEVANLRKVLDGFAKQDPRIKIVHLKDNLGIAGNTNAAINLAMGDFIGFMDHDDLLASFALFEVVKRLQIDTTADLIYSDEDKIDESGNRFDPFFKPDFSPDYLRSVNYMPHFLFVRKSLGDTIGWFREGYDGAQDYDLILRLVESASCIIHVPKILYHWRAWTESTAGRAEVKPYANTSGKKALQEHLDRIGLSAEVENGYVSTLYHVKYHILNAPLISIIIPSQDHGRDLENCIDSILQKSTYPNFEIFMVENGSKEQGTFNLYKRFLEKDRRVHLIEWDPNEPFNFSRVNNWAARQANGEILLFLNNDIQVINNDWLEQMLQFALRPDVGAVGAKLYYPDESIQHAGVIVGLGGVAGHSHKHYPRHHPGYFRRLETVQNLSAVTAACLMVRKQVFLEINGFDESYVLAFGDVDLCLSILQKGYLNVWTPYSELYHHESKTRGFEDIPEKQERFTREVNYFKHKWAKQLEEGDPYYNPNLTLGREDYSIDPRKKPD